jgi:hypothetical protein
VGNISERSAQVDIWTWKDETAKNYRKVRNVNLNNLYSSTNILG